MFIDLKKTQKHSTIFTYLIILLLLNFHLSAQNNLQTKITINAKNEPLSEVLNEISIQAQVNFSYNNKEINTDKKISLVARNQTVENVLNILTNDLNLEYKVVEKQIGIVNLV